MWLSREKDMRTTVAAYGENLPAGAPAREWEI
jgi:hypothetical protein